MLKKKLLLLTTLLCVSIPAFAMNSTYPEPQGGVVMSELQQKKIWQQAAIFVLSLCPDTPLTLTLTLTLTRDQYFQLLGQLFELFKREVNQDFEQWVLFENSEKSIPEERTECKDGVRYVTAEGEVAIAREQSNFCAEYIAVTLACIDTIKTTFGVFSDEPFQRALDVFMTELYADASFNNLQKAFNEMGVLLVKKGLQQRPLTMSEMREQIPTFPQPENIKQHLLRQCMWNEEGFKRAQELHPDFFAQINAAENNETRITIPREIN